MGEVTELNRLEKGEALRERVWGPQERVGPSVITGGPGIKDGLVVAIVPSD